MTLVFQMGVQFQKENVIFQGVFKEIILEVFWKKKFRSFHKLLIPNPFSEGKLPCYLGSYFIFWKTKIQIGHLKNTLLT